MLQKCNFTLENALFGQHFLCVRIASAVLARSVASGLKAAAEEPAGARGLAAPARRGVPAARVAPGAARSPRRSANSCGDALPGHGALWTGYHSDTENC